MRTGIVFDINKNKAIIMKHGGEFIEVRALSHWKKGDIVNIEDKKTIPKAFYYAASVALIVFLSFFGFRIYFEETTLISMDVNPSIELGINRFDRVVYLNSLNNDGNELLQSLNIKNKTYEEALKLIAYSEKIKEYIKEDFYFTFALQTKDKEKETLISAQLEEAFQEFYSSDSTENIDIFVVDEETVNEAHGCHMTPGKYVKFQQLKELDPDADAEDYTDMSIGEIQKCINSHHNNQENNSQENNSQEDDHHSNDTQSDENVDSEDCEKCKNGNKQEKGCH